MTVASVLFFVWCIGAGCIVGLAVYIVAGMWDGDDEDWF